MSDETPTPSPDDKSKSQVKRELEALKDLGRQLIDLPARQLQMIPMNETTHSAIIDAQSMKKGAMKRQHRYIAGLLRDEDVVEMRNALAGLLQPHRQQVRAHHQLEQWRDALIAGEDGIVTELAGRFANLDRQYLMQQVRSARKELTLEKPPRAARAIFQYLKDLQAEE